MRLALLRRIVLVEALTEFSTSDACHALRHKEE